MLPTKKWVPGYINKCSWQLLYHRDWQLGAIKKFMLKYVPASLSDSYNYSISFKFQSFILIQWYVGEWFEKS